MQVNADRVRDIGLAEGERRLVHVRANSVLVGVRGSQVMVEQQLWLADAGFRIRTPLRQGETCCMAFGGHLVLLADGPACVRLLPPPSIATAAVRHVLAAAGALLRAVSACGRRLRRRAEA